MKQLSWPSRPESSCWPEVRIRERYQRLWTHVAAMVEIADTVEVFDNSGEGPRTVALFVAGEQIGQARWPTWTPSALLRLT